MWLKGGCEKLVVNSFTKNGNWVLIVVDYNGSEVTCFHSIRAVC